jgi:uncharacterized RDD family membrane protein YckC
MSTVAGETAVSTAVAKTAPPPPDAAPDTDTRYIGVVTRSVSWGIDAVLINLVAIITGLGVTLILSIFPLAHNLHGAFELVAGGVYIAWVALYFIGFWSIAGQTPGARIMQIRLITGRRRKVKPVRATVRWIGMNLAMLPLFLGFAPILFGRRGFPDWLARTLVVDAEQLSLAEARQVKLAALRSERADEAPSPP